MRIFILSALLTLAFLLPRHACAQGFGDTLFDHNLTFTGQIIQETGTNGTTVTKPITPATVLNALSITSTTSKLKFYYDNSAGDYVVAPKGISNGQTGTPAATVLSLSGTGSIAWDPNVNSTILAGPASGLNGSVTGSYAAKEVIVHGTEIFTINFILSGNAGGIPTIMEGKLVDTFHP